MAVRDWLKTEDGWAVWIGLLIFALALPASQGIDLLGWGVSTSEWLDIHQAVSPASETYQWLPGPAGLGLTYLFLLGLLTAGAAVLGFDLRRFVFSFTFIFGV